MNFPGFEEICTLVIVWMYFIGSANASREQTHISADMLELFVKKARARQFIILLRRIVGVAVIAVMAYLSVDFLAFSAAQGASSTNYHIPMYFYHISLVLGMFLMLFYDVCYLVNDILIYRHPEGGEKKSDTEEAPE